MSLGDASAFTCPECHGALIKITNGKLVRFRCHTGHAFSINNLLAELTESTENTLWSAVRAIDENIMLLIIWRNTRGRPRNSSWRKCWRAKRKSRNNTLICCEKRRSAHAAVNTGQLDERD